MITWLLNSNFAPNVHFLDGGVAYFNMSHETIRAAKVVGDCQPWSGKPYVSAASLIEIHSNGLTARWNEVVVEAKILGGDTEWGTELLMIALAILK